MDTDKIKVFGARFKVDGTGKLAELERAEKVGLLQLISPMYRLTVPIPFCRTK
jgi:hypothetical protein